jgi:hypothetical protein
MVLKPIPIEAFNVCGALLRTPVPLSITTILLEPTPAAIFAIQIAQTSWVSHRDASGTVTRGEEEERGGSFTTRQDDLEQI